VGERFEDPAVWSRLRAQRVVYGRGAAQSCAIAKRFLLVLLGRLGVNELRR
jgi:hypothetical protein